MSVQSIPNQASLLSAADAYADYLSLRRALKLPAKLRARHPCAVKGRFLGMRALERGAVEQRGIEPRAQKLGPVECGVLQFGRGEPGALEFRALE